MNAKRSSRANINPDRTGGRDRKVAVKPPVVAFSDDFTFPDNPPRPYETSELGAKARQRGFVDAETPQAQHILETIGFQHASGYFNLFKDKDGRVEDGASMKELHAVILFDRKLQALIVEYIGLFELKFRARYSYSMSQRKGAFAHRDPRNFKNRAHFDSFLKSYSREFQRQLDKNREIAVFFNQYGDAPIWAAVEIMSFGTLSKLYRNTKAKAVKRDVAEAFGTNVDDFESWTRSLSGVRNTCAHFGRLSGTPLVIRPRMIPGLNADNGTPFYALLVLARLFRNCKVFDDDETLSYNFAMMRDAVQLFVDFEDVLSRCKIPGNWLALLVGAATESADLSIADDFVNRDKASGRVWLRLYSSDGDFLDIGRAANSSFGDG